MADPDPFTIIAMLASVTGASIAAVNYWRTHHKQLPSKVRAKLLRELDELSEEVAHVRADLKVVEEIFSRADFPNGKAIRLGNGALLSRDDFNRYMRVSDSVFQRLRRVNKSALRAERLSMDVPSLERSVSTKLIGDAVEQLDGLLSNRNLSIDTAWDTLQSALATLQEMVDNLRSQLRRSR